MSALLPLLLVPFVQDTAPLDQVAVRVDDRRELRRLHQNASDVDDHSHRPDGRAIIHADDAEQGRLVELGFELEVLQEDLSAFYAARLAAEAPDLGPGGSMGGWRIFSEIVAQLDTLSATYPAIVSPKFSVGQSLEGRDIWAVRISDTPTVDDPTEPVAWFDSLHHCREVITAETLLLFMEQLAQDYPTDPDTKRMVDTRNLVFVPVVNPDGYEYNYLTNPGGGGLWRKNRRDNGDGTFGVDLNRNYGWEWGPQWPGSSGDPGSTTYRGPSAFSEPETQVMRDFMATHPPTLALSVHSTSNVWIHPWGYDTVPSADQALFQAIGGAMCAQNGWLVGNVQQTLGYIANGGTFDWLYGTHDTVCFTPEIGDSAADGFWPPLSRIPDLYEDVRPGYELNCKWAGGWIEVDGFTLQDLSGDFDGEMEPGEVFALRLTLSNGGMAPGAGTARITSTSGDVIVEVDTAAFDVEGRSLAGQGGGFPLTVGGTATGPAAPLRGESLPFVIRIAEDALAGSVDVDVELDYDGLATAAEPVRLPLGEERILAHDTMDADLGWQVSNATNWSWERAAPEATSIGGQDSQPGEDNPAGSGTSCYVTGAAAGASAGSNDVDGTTVLTSPVFRTSGFANVELEYARWFGNLPGGPLDDVFLAEVSNDGGGSWATLESTPNANAWNTVTFALEDAVALTDLMVLRITVADDPNNDITEGLVDDLVLRTSSYLPSLGAWGDDTNGAVAHLFVHGPPNTSYTIRSSAQAGAGTTQAGTGGTYFLEGTVTDVASGTTDSAGRYEVAVQWPSAGALYLQAVLDEGGSQAAWSNLLTVDVQ